LGDRPDEPVPVAIETTRGLLVAALRATGRPVFAINPLAVARYRERHSVSGKKSDHGDAVVLANILRTDRHAHRALANDSELAQAVAVLARAQQDAVWARTDAHNELRSVLREFYPSMLAAFADKRGGIMRAEARLILAAAPTPIQAARLTVSKIRSLLRKAGRVRQLDEEAHRLQKTFRLQWPHQLVQVEEAFGLQAAALLRMLDVACANADALERATAEAFVRHPDAEIITSFPGLGTITGARVLAEIGDDRARFVDARGLKAYAGAAPVTRASGKTCFVTARKIKNDRLADAGYAWGLHGLDRIVRCQGALRPATGHRRSTPCSPEAPVQSTDRMPPPLPRDRPAVQGSRCISSAIDSKCLTPTGVGCLVGPAQLPVLPLELGDPPSLLGRGARPGAVVDLGLADPVAKRLGADAELAGDLGDHAEAVAALLDGLLHHPDRPLTQLGRVLPGRGLGCHLCSILSKRWSLHQTQGGSTRGLSGPSRSSESIAAYDRCGE
jgi:transposase